MDTENFDYVSKHGTATSAGLLRLEPHVEVIGHKPSAVSWDEKRLFAGIPAIGLQT
jgi:hypothetical protein